MRGYPLLVANWKMYPSVSDAAVVAGGVKQALEEIHHLEVVLCPPSLLVPIVHEITTDKKLGSLHLGLQNIHYQDKGAFTGEISAAMAKGFVSYVILGHSERIRFFHETLNEVNLKLHAALRNGLTPILCVGELQASGQAGKEVVSKLTDQLLKDVKKSDYDKLVIAYEPVWAISEVSGGQSADPDYIDEVAKQIRKVVGSDARIIYGGSVDADNLASFLALDEIEGALVGQASLKVKEFIKMCEIASEIK